MAEVREDVSFGYMSNMDVNVKTLKDLNHPAKSNKHMQLSTNQ